ncbi:MAG: endonuclease domain-containing protein [Bacteroidales bacterium]|nr:endonuclease domain-containing protein [Bacteroidales bacterium]
MVKLRGRDEYPIYFGATPELLLIAADLRKTMTDTEKILWNKLRNRQVAGFRFRRQHPIREFVVDFFCYEAMLVIEIDGDVHEEAYQKERDVERTKILRSLGLMELRFKNAAVLKNIESVIKKIESELEQFKLSIPFPRVGEGARGWGLIRII